MISPLVPLAALFALSLLLAAFFAASETALVALTRLDLANLRASLHPAAERLDALKRHPGRVLSTALLGQNLSSSAASALATVLAQQLLGGRAAVGVAILASTLLLFGAAEMAPKSAAAAQPARVAVLVARPFEILTSLLRPFAASIQAVVSLFLKLVGLSVSPARMTEEEVRAAINLGRDEGAIADEVHRVLTRVLEFQSRRVSEVMVPRPKIVAVAETASFDEVRRRLNETKFSRLPVYRDSLDNVVGILRAKDLYDLTDEEERTFRVADRMSPPFLVPESKRIEDLFREMRKRRSHMAIGVDEYGGTAGLVTIEDVIETLLGSIQDEDDDEGPKIRKVDDRTYLLDGTLKLEDLQHQFGISYPNAGVETIAGLLLVRFGRIPARGEKMRGRQAEYVILDATPTAIKSVRMTLPRRARKTRSE